MTTLKGNTQSMHWGVGCDLDQSAINGGEGSVGWGGGVGVLVGGWGPKTKTGNKPTTHHTELLN